MSTLRHFDNIVNVLRLHFNEPHWFVETELSKPVKSDHRYAPDGHSTWCAVNNSRYLTPDFTVYPPVCSGRYNSRCACDDPDQKVWDAEVHEEKTSCPRHCGAGRYQDDQIDDVGQDNTAADDCYDGRLKYSNECLIAAHIWWQCHIVVTLINWRQHVLWYQGAFFFLHRPIISAVFLLSCLVTLLAEFSLVYSRLSWLCSRLSAVWLTATTLVNLASNKPTYCCCCCCCCCYRCCWLYLILHVAQCCYSMIWLV